MYIVRLLEKRDNLLDFFQGIGAPLLPSWVEVLLKKEWILSPSTATDGSNVAHNNGRVEVNRAITTCDQEYSTQLNYAPKTASTKKGHISMLLVWSRLIPEADAAAADTQPLEICGYTRTRISDSY
jgi:hypothetical protein